MVSADADGDFSTAAESLSSPSPSASSLTAGVATGSSGGSSGAVSDDHQRHGAVGSIDRSGGGARLRVVAFDDAEPTSWSASSSPRTHRAAASRTRRQLPALLHDVVTSGGGVGGLRPSPLIISGPQSVSAESVPAQTAIKKRQQQQQHQRQQILIPPTRLPNASAGTTRAWPDGRTDGRTNDDDDDEERRTTTQNDDDEAGAERRFLTPGSYQAAAPTSRSVRLTNVKAKSFEETSC